MTTGANVQVLYYWKHKKLTIMFFFLIFSPICKGHLAPPWDLKTTAWNQQTEESDDGDNGEEEQWFSLLHRSTNVASSSPFS